MKEYSFDAIILKANNVDSGFIEFPFDVEKEFGKKGQVKVKAWFDGFEYRGSLVKMGHPCHIIGLNKKVRDAIQKKAGDTLKVLIVEDTDIRTVDIPADLLMALALNKDAENVFEKLSFTHRKEYAEWIVSAKKQETRNARILKTMERLLSGNKGG